MGDWSQQDFNRIEVPPTRLRYGEWEPDRGVQAAILGPRWHPSRPSSAGLAGYLWLFTPPCRLVWKNLFTFFKNVFYFLHKCLFNFPPHYAIIATQKRVVFLARGSRELECCHESEWKTGDNNKFESNGVSPNEKGRKDVSFKALSIFSRAWICPLRVKRSLLNTARCRLVVSLVHAFSLRLLLQYCFW